MFKQLIYIIPVFLLLSCDKYEISPDQSKTFIKYFGGANENKGVKILNTSEGYMVVGFMTSSTKGKDIAICFTDEYGNLTSEIKTFGNRLDETITNIISDNSGYYYLCGSSQINTNNADAYVAKINNIGDTLWTRTYGGDFNDIAYDLAYYNNEIYVVGKIGLESNQSDKLIAKWDANGNFIKSNNSGTIGSIYFTSIEKGDGDIFHLTGAIARQPSNPDNFDVIYTEVNSNISSLFNTFTVDLSYDEVSVELITTTTGDKLFLIEQTRGDEKIPYVVLHNKKQILWSNSVQITGAISVNDIILDNDQIFVLANSELNNRGNIHLVNFTLHSDIQNLYSVGDAGKLYGNEIIPDNNGYVIVGTNDQLDGNSSILLLKLNKQLRFN